LEEKGEQIEKYRSELFMRKYMPKVRSFPRVRELFERIRADGKKIALASSSDKKQLTILNKIAQVEYVVDCETSADDIDSSKPDPDVFHAALKCLRQTKPDEAIAVGDTPYDAEGARKAGIQTIGLLCGGFPESSLRASGCIAIYRDPADLLANYETSPLASRVAALR